MNHELGEEQELGLEEGHKPLGLVEVLEVGKDLRAREVVLEAGTPSLEAP
jgi:hypothetical protein